MLLFFFKCSDMSNNLDASNTKWTLNRIIIIKHCTLIYTNVAVWDNVRDTYQIQYIIVNITINIVGQ